MALKLIDALDYELASSQIYRDGCVYREPSQQCDFCRPAIALRKALRDYWDARKGEKMWHEYEPQMHPEWEVF